MALQSSQRLPETAFYTKKSKGFFKFYILLGYPYRTPNPELQKTKELFIQSRIQFYVQKAKRSSTSIHPTRPSKGIPGLPATRPSKGIPDIPDIPVIHDIQPFQAILHTSRDSSQFYKFYKFYNLQHSPARMHILHILHFNWFPQKLHRVPVETLQTFILQRKGDVAISLKTYCSKMSR